MSEDVLSRAEEACEKLESKDESVDRHYWQAVAGDLLPQLLAKAKRLQNEIEIYKMGEEAANELILQGRAAEADRDAWKAKAIEERAIQKSGFMNDVLDEVRDTWTYDITESARDWARGEAARELEEEMKHV